MYLWVVIFITSCALPKQPDLTGKEIQYFKELEAKCHCKIIREVNIYVTKEFRKYPNDIGYYYIGFKDLPCAVLASKDSLSKVAMSVAKKLNQEVIGKDFQYLDEEITVVFECNPSPNSSNSVSFDFKPKDLKF